MKRTALILLACAALVVAPRASLAQQTAPEPTPADWMVYDDPAMHFHAPAGFQPIGQRQIPINKLGEDPSVVAARVFQTRNISARSSFSKNTSMVPTRAHFSVNMRIRCVIRSATRSLRTSRIFH